MRAQEAPAAATPGPRSLPLLACRGCGPCAPPLFLLGRGRAARILVLPFVALRDRGFPRILVAVEPGVVPGLSVGLALVLALLVDGDRGLLSAARDAQRQRRARRRNEELSHDFVAPGCGAA